MPFPTGITESRYSALKNELSKGLTIPDENTFDHDENIELPIQDEAVPNMDPQKWRGINLKLRSFIIGLPTPDNDDDDEPFFLAHGSSPKGPQIVRWPDTTPAPSTGKNIRRTINRTVAFHNSLDREGPVQVYAEGTAYEEDFASVLNALMDAIKADAASALVFTTDIAEGLNGWQTPGAAVRTVSSLLPNFQDNMVGGDEPVLDSTLVEWFRKAGSHKQWVCRKFTLHTANISQNAYDALDSDKKPGWYLAEWILTLGTSALNYDTLAMVAPPMLETDKDQAQAIVAALHVMDGRDLETMATEYGVPIGMVMASLNALPEYSQEAVMTVAEAYGYPLVTSVYYTKFVEPFV